MRRSAAPDLALLIAAVIAALVSSPGGGTLGAQPPNAGKVTGQVKLTSRIRGAAMPSAAYPSRAVGRRETPQTAEIRNVVVYLREPGFRGTLTPRRVQVRQEHETFIPHIVAVARGSTVDFPNADPFFHNVFSLSSAANFNLGRYPRGESRAQTFTKAGMVKVFCQIHSHMSATILVFDHPYFAVPDTAGNYELPNLPPGDYTVVGWHERVGERVQQVRVHPGQTVSVNLSLPVEASQ